MSYGYDPKTRYQRLKCAFFSMVIRPLTPSAPYPLDMVR